MSQHCFVCIRQHLSKSPLLCQHLLNHYCLVSVSLQLLTSPSMQQHQLLHLLLNNSILQLLCWMMMMPFCSVLIRWKMKMTHQSMHIQKLMLKTDCLRLRLLDHPKRILNLVLTLKTKLKPLKLIFIMIIWLKRVRALKVMFC